jgi:hypothetical protein
MGSWSFLTNHARALLCIADDPGARLRDIAAVAGVTERRAHAIVTDLIDAGYVVKEKTGRRNRYRIQKDLPLRDPIDRQRTIGELLDLLVGPDDAQVQSARSSAMVGDGPAANRVGRRPIV